MTFEYGTKVKGLEEVTRKLRNADAEESIVLGFQWGMKELVQEMRYPPVSEANRPHTKVYTDPATGRQRTRVTWYQRGIGQKYQRDDGSVYTQHTSEDLENRWKTKLIRNRGGVRKIQGKVANTASYSPWVVTEEMPHYHKRRGWKDIKKKGEEVSKKVAKQIIEDFKRRFRRG